MCFNLTCKASLASFVSLKPRKALLTLTVYCRDTSEDLLQLLPQGVCLEEEVKAQHFCFFTNSSFRINEFGDAPRRICLVTGVKNATAVLLCILVSRGLYLSSNRKHSTFPQKPLTICETLIRHNKSILNTGLSCEVIMKKGNFITCHCAQAENFRNDNTLVLFEVNSPLEQPLFLNALCLTFSLLDSQYDYLIRSAGICVCVFVLGCVQGVYRKCFWLAVAVCLKLEAWASTVELLQAASDCRTLRKETRGVLKSG